MNNTFDPWDLTNTINVTFNGEYNFKGPRKIININENNSKNKKI